MTRPTPRRPSRTSTPRPRKIAGRADAPAPVQRDSIEPGATEPGATEPDSTQPAPVSSSRPAVESAVITPPPTDDEESTQPARGTGRTSTLLALLGLLVVLLVAQCAWFVWNSARDVEVAESAPAADSEDGGPQVAVPSDRPVVLNQLAVQEGVDAAAAAAQTMFGRNWESYDEGVDDAVALMTEEFGEEFRATAEDVRQEFVRKRTEVQVRVVAQSVVRANDTELEALVFLNQYVFRGEGEDAKSTYTPYRAVLTMVHTDQGWLVDGVATK